MVPHLLKNSHNSIEKSLQRMLVKSCNSAHECTNTILIARKNISGFLAVETALHFYDNVAQINTKMVSKFSLCSFLSFYPTI